VETEAAETVDTRARQVTSRAADLMGLFFRGRGGWRPDEDLFVGEEFFAEAGAVDLLDGGLLGEGVGGGGGGALAEDHEDGLHADGAVGDVGGGEGDGDEEVFALGGARRDRAVGDG